MEGGAKNENFSCAYLLSLDFDDGTKIEDFLKEAKEIELPPTFIYKTFSHTDNFNKFRVVWRLRKPIHNPQLKNTLQLKLMSIFKNCDRACKDLSRLWVGGKGLAFYNINNTLNIDILNNLSSKIEFDTNRVITNNKTFLNNKLSISNYNSKLGTLKKDKLNYPIDLDLVNNNCMLYNDFINGKILDHMEINHLSNNLYIYKNYDNVLEETLKKYNYNNWENKYNTVVSSVNYEYKASRCSLFCKYYSKCNVKNIRKKVQNSLLEIYNDNISIQKQLTYKKYLTDAENIKNELLSLCVKEGTHLLEASTGAGKTYLISYVFKELSKIYPNRLFVIACPNRVQNLQNEKSYNLVALVGGEFVENIEYNTISMVYDKASNITDYIVKNNIDLTLIIDEAHQLVYSNLFRRQALNNLKSLQDIANTTIHITATPRANLFTYKYDSYINCVSKYKNDKIENLFIVNGSKEDLEIKLYNIINQEIKQNKQVLVFLDNKDKIKEMFKYQLKERFKDKNIAFLDSENKGSDLFNSIITNSKIPKQIDILITTSVLECGTNIKNENLTVIYYQNNNSFSNIDKVEQSLARAREKQDKAYVFITKNEENKDKKFIPLEYVVSNYKMQVQQQLKNLKTTYSILKNGVEEHTELKEELFNNIKAILDSKNICGNKLTECVYFEEDTEQFIINNEALTKQALRLYDLQFINHLEKLKDILFDKCKANKIEIIYLDKQDDKLFKQNKEKIKEQNKEVKEELKEKEEQFKKDLKNLLDNNLIEYLKNIDIDENDKYYLEDNLSDEQLSFAHKIINNNFYYSIILDLVNSFNKQYKKYNKYKNIYNINYYLEFEDILDSYLETNNKASFNNDIEAKLYNKYNKQSWSKDKDILTLLKEEKQEYSIIRLFLDSRRTQKLSDKLINNLYKELSKNNNKKPSKKTLGRLKKKIKAIYNINSDDIITSLK